MEGIGFVLMAVSYRQRANVVPGHPISGVPRYKEEPTASEHSTGTSMRRLFLLPGARTRPPRRPGSGFERPLMARLKPNHSLRQRVTWLCSGGRSNRCGDLFVSRRSVPDSDPDGPEYGFRLLSPFFVHSATTPIARLPQFDCNELGDG
ncbi:hypothetical protein R1flu_026645 [Riccia fluitans]|uniref:Uncharacterized protein n=1 Tax=Riccia fluitans TaxID=41844 RepID=A0ABD1XGJ8_9MARC